MQKALFWMVVLLVAGCRGPEPVTAPSSPSGSVYVRLGELELSALVEFEPGTVYAAVEIMNEGEVPVRLQYDGFCKLAILLFDRPQAQAPLWDSSHWWAQRQGSCPSSAIDLEIPAGTLARVIAPAVETENVLGDSLAPARYLPAVRLRLLAPMDTTLILPSEPIRLDPPDPEWPFPGREAGALPSSRAAWAGWHPRG